MEFYGREYHLRACDDFTRRHLLSEGVEEEEEEEEGQGCHSGAKAGQSCQAPEEEAAPGGGEPAREESKLRKFLENDGKVLRSGGKRKIKNSSSRGKKMYFKKS